MRTIGKIILNKQLKETEYYWGPISEIEGKELPVIEKNKYGDCMCMVKDKGLVDVHACDIRVYLIRI